MKTAVLLTLLPLLGTPLPAQTENGHAEAANTEETHAKEIQGDPSAGQNENPHAEGQAMAPPILERLSDGAVCAIYPERVTVAHNGGAVIHSSAGPVDTTVLSAKIEKVRRKNKSSSAMTYRWEPASSTLSALTDDGPAPVKVGRRALEKLEAEAADLCAGVPLIATGVFRLDLDFGSRQVVDELRIEKGADGILTGTYAFPGRFTEEILDLAFEDGALAFHFFLKEGDGPTQKIHVAVDFSDATHFAGTLSIGESPFPITGIQTRVIQNPPALTP